MNARLYRLDCDVGRAHVETCVGSGDIRDLASVAINDPDDALWRYSIAIDGRQRWTAADIQLFATACGINRAGPRPR